MNIYHLRQIPSTEPNADMHRRAPAVATAQVAAEGAVVRDLEIPGSGQNPTCGGSRPVPFHPGASSDNDEDGKRLMP